MLTKTAEESCYSGADERRANTSQRPITIAHIGTTGAEK